MVFHKRDEFMAFDRLNQAVSRSPLYALSWTLEYNAKREGDGIPMKANNNKEARRRKCNNVVVKMKVGRNIKREAVCRGQ
jgi:hypothetical protein